jgi:hypothetical protein
VRIQMSIDGASTEAVRELAAALSQVGLRQTLQVGCDGPEKWTAITPKMTPTQHASVVARLVKFQGEPVATILDGLRG